VIGHDDLALSLAAHLRGPDRMVWTDMQLGPVGSPRPDVYTIDKSYAHPHPVAYEIKVSLSDYAGDVTAGKWQAYLRYACGVYFACEAGLLTKDVIPTHCGLYTYKDGRWRAAKRAVLNPVVIPQDALLKLLIDGVNREGPTGIRHRVWTDYAHMKQISEVHGELVAKAINNYKAVEHEAAYAKHSADRIIKDAQDRAERITEDATSMIEPARRELCTALGLPQDANLYQVQAAVRALRESLKQHPAVAQYQNAKRILQHALDQMNADHE
jgi:3-methyladenine DNA glycosylase AlkC